MPRENNVIVDAVFGQNASTTIPTPPVAGVPYRNDTLDSTTIENGQNYQSPYSSANYNQFFYLLSSVAKTLCENGVMPWVTGQAYADGARALYTDGKLYRATRAILANESPYPEPTYSTAWTCDLDGYLPLSGGTMTGTILTAANPALGCSAANEALRIFGSNNWTTGARIAFHPASGSGMFFLSAIKTDGTLTFIDLEGNADNDTLRWGSNYIVAKKAVVYNSSISLTQNTYTTITLQHANDYHANLGYYVSGAWPASTWSNAGVYIMRVTAHDKLEVISHSSTQNYNLSITEIYV